MRNIGWAVGSLLTLKGLDLHKRMEHLNTWGLAGRGTADESTEMYYRRAAQAILLTAIGLYVSDI